MYTYKHRISNLMDSLYIFGWKFNPTDKNWENIFTSYIITHASNHMSSNILKYHLRQNIALSLHKINQDLNKINAEHVYMMIQYLATLKRLQVCIYVVLHVYIYLLICMYMY